MIYEHEFSIEEIRSFNFRSFLKYELIYLAASMVGATTGALFIVLRPSTFVFVLGIIICVFSGLLFACAVLMAIAPKNSYGSLITLNKPTEKIVAEFNESNFTITVNDETVEFSYRAATAFKETKTAYYLIYEKRVLPIQKSEDGAEKIADFIRSKIN